MNDPFLRVAQEMGPRSNTEDLDANETSHNDPPPEQNQLDSSELDDALEERSDEDAGREDLDDSALLDARLARIKDYALDALERQDHMEASIATVNASLMHTHAHYLQAINNNLAADAYSLASFDENHTHLRTLLNLTNQVHQTTQLELKIRRAPQRDPLRSHRLPPSRPR